MIAAVMGFAGLSKLAPWLQELIFVAIVALLLAGGYGLWHHKVYAAGKDAEIAVVTKKAAADTAAAQTRATTAEKTYADEHEANLDYQFKHPDDQPLRLCQQPKPVRQSGAAVKGAAEGGASAANVPEVPSGDHQLRTAGEPPDIHGLLQLLAVKADDVSATLREAKAR